MPAKVKLNGIAENAPALTAPGAMLAPSLAPPPPLMLMLLNVDAAALGGGVELDDQRTHVVVGRDGLAETHDRRVVGLVRVTRALVGGDQVLRLASSACWDGDLLVELGDLRALGRQDQLPVAADGAERHDSHDQDPERTAHGVAPPWGVFVVVAEVVPSPSPAAGVAVGVGVGVALTVPVAVVGVAATAAASFSKKATTSKVGRVADAARLGVADIEFGAAGVGGGVDLLGAGAAQRDARDAIDVFRRAIRRATWVCPGRSPEA